MNLDELRKSYDNSADFIKDFNTIIDVVISNYYQSKKSYDDSIRNNSLKNIDFSIKPNIKKWEVNYIEPKIMNVIQQTHQDWETYNEVRKEYGDEWEYLCTTMAALKEYIHTESFIIDIYNFLNK